MAGKKGIVNKKSKTAMRLGSRTPDELREVWKTDIVQENWNKLNAKYRKFFLEYLNNNYNPTAAFRTINPKANEEYCPVAGNRMIRNVHIDLILKELSKPKIVDFHKIEHVYVEAMKATRPFIAKSKDGGADLVMEVEDHKIRIEGAKEFAKLQGFTSDNNDNKPPIGVQVNINPAMVNNINGFLVAAGAPPIHVPNTNDIDTNEIHSEEVDYQTFGGEMSVEE